MRAVNHEIFDWKGEDVNTRPTATHTSYLPLRNMRAMRKLELLKRHNDSSTYGRLVRRAQSFLITRVRLLTEVASAQPFDTEYALRMRYQQAGSMDRLNRGNPVLEWGRNPTAVRRRPDDI